MTTDILTARELARWLKLSPDTVKQMARNGRIPSIRISPKVIRFELAAVKAALKTQFQANWEKGASRDL